MKAMKRLTALIAIGGLATLMASDPRAKGAGTITGNVARSQDALVFLDKVAGNFTPDAAGVVDQENLKFIPKVLVVLQGSEVEFKNSDDERHNVFGVGRDEFDLGTWTKGITRKHTFKKVGSTALLCNVHPEMEAHVVVLQNPFYARPDSSGKFTIADVPAGKYNLIYWRPNVKAKKKSIVVEGGPVTVDFK